MAYIGVPIDADPDDILNDAYTYLQGVIAGWTPANGNLDVWLLHAISSAAAELKSVTSAVPTDIFRWFGANLINLPPIDATQASTTITVTMQDNAGYTIPNGTQVSIDQSGDVTIPFQVVGDQVVPGGTTVRAGIPIKAVNAGADGSSLGSIGGPVHLLDPLTFVTTITQDAVTTGGVDDEDDPTYLNRLTAQLQLLAPRPILARDFAVFARNITGVFRATAIDGYNPLHNLLTLNEASLETSIANWVNLANANPTQTGAQAADGIKSLQLSSIAAGDMSAILSGGGGPKAVTPGDMFTALAFFRTAVTVRNCKVGISWRDAGNVQIGAVEYGATVADSAANFNATAFVTAIAPALAVTAQVVVTVMATGGAAEVHYVDKISLRRGSGTDWVPGDTSETGNPRMISEAAVDSAGAPVSAGIKTAISADAQARREANFIVSVIDPTVNLIDITYQVKALAGFDHAALVTAINAALTAYLNPASWGTVQGGDPRDWTNITTIRYLEIASIINAVDGVDYITTTAGNYDLTIARHLDALARVDINMAGVAALPTANTLTGVAV